MVTEDYYLRLIPENNFRVSVLSNFKYYIVLTQRGV